MTRALAAAVLILALAAAAAAGFTSSEWQFRKPIRIEAVGAPYAEIVLDGETCGSATESLADLRVISSTGEEVPYWLRSWPGSHTETAIGAAMLNQAVLTGRYTRFELRAADAGRPHNRIRLSIEDREFRRRVTLEGSDDRRTWYVLAQPVIFRFTEETSVERTTLVYPRSLYRYVRVTIHDDGERPLTISTAALLFDEAISPREDKWYDRPVESKSGPGHQTTVTIDLQFRHVPIDRMALVISRPAAFARTAEVAVSDDGQTWIETLRVQLFRPSGVGAEMPLELAVGDIRGRYVRVSVANGDSPPLEITRATVYGIRRTLLFAPAPNRSYWLYLGSAAVPPQYDLPQLLGREPRTITGVGASLGRLEPNPAYRPPQKPWTEEHPALLWAILGIVVVGLGLLILSTMRKTGTAP